MNKNTAFIFDFETNGLHNCSVLSLSFIIAQNNTILKQETRYYYPKEDYNYHAINVNGLDEQTLINYKTDTLYPDYFEDDHEWLIDIFEEYQINQLVAHNISFDRRFLPPSIIENITNKKLCLFCTMNENKQFTNIIKNGRLKAPSLKETCETYGIEFDTTQAHKSEYDTYKAYEVYLKMNDMNSQLKKLYEQAFEKQNLQENFLPTLSAPFLIKLEPSYMDSDLKILFVGKETNKWWGNLQKFCDTENAIDLLLQRYKNEITQEPKWNNSFFVEYKKIRKALLENKKGSLVWTNLLKMDSGETGWSRNTIKNNAVVQLSKPIFLKELKILKPDFIIFATSYTYDEVIVEFFENKIKNSNVIESKCLWEFEYEGITCYRTWHPASIRYTASKDKLEYYKDIIELIKNKKSI